MLGKYACLKAIKFTNHPNDLQNINLFPKWISLKFLNIWYI
jgi:hypothetical protein